MRWIIALQLRTTTTTTTTTTTKSVVVSGSCGRALLVLVQTRIWQASVFRFLQATLRSGWQRDDSERTK
jgi:hypothetical protein